MLNNDYVVSPDGNAVHFEIYSRAHGTRHGLIDRVDFDRLHGTVSVSRPGNDQMLVCTLRVGDRRVSLHRVIMGALPNQEVFHRNRDKLDNRRANLDMARHHGPAKAHTRMHRNNTTGYRGVSRYGHRYRATISDDGHTQNLGSYANPIEAAHAYDDAAVAYWGDAATLNFPREEKSYVA